MTRAISFNPIGKFKEKIGKLGEATRRRKEVENLRVKANQLEGIEFKALPEATEPLQLPFGVPCFDSEGEAFDQIPAGLLLNGKIEEHQNELLPDQLTLLALVDHAAEITGLEVNIEKVVSLSPKEPIVHASIRPGKAFHGLIDSGFEGQKALPPASKEFVPLSEMFRDSLDKEVIKATKKAR